MANEEKAPVPMQQDALYGGLFPGSEIAQSGRIYCCTMCHRRKRAWEAR